MGDLGDFGWSHSWLSFITAEKGSRGHGGGAQNWVEGLFLVSFVFFSQVTRG